MVNEVLSIVRLKVKEENITMLDIQLAVDEVEETIKNYCNISLIPKSLKFTWVNMSVDLVKYTYESNRGGEDGIDGIDIIDISSLKIGDTNINLGNTNPNNNRSRTLKSHLPNLDEIVLNYSQQLNSHRRMVW